MVNEKELKSTNRLVNFIPYAINLLLGIFISIYFYLDFIECESSPLRGGFLRFCFGILFILWIWIYLIICTVIFIILKKFYRHVSYLWLYIISLLIGFVVFIVIVFPLGNLIAYLTGW